MSVLNLFSHRKRLAEGSGPDVFVYDELPEEVGVQIVHVLRASIGAYDVSHLAAYGSTNNNKGWHHIHSIIAREHGVFSLGQQANVSDNVLGYFVEHSDVYRALDVVEVCFTYIDATARSFDPLMQQGLGITQGADDAIAELNERFRRAGVGYRFERGKILRVDSELIHSEVVKPALQYLNEPGFAGPREEFLRAHGHYRAGEIEAAVTDANNAFESTLKVVCDQRKWHYERGARASDLLNVVRKNGLLPGYLDTSFDQLVATLKTGLPKLRNEQGRHGQGARPRKAPDFVAAYALHLAAAYILFVVEAHKAMG